MVFIIEIIVAIILLLITIALDTPEKSAKKKALRRFITNNNKVDLDIFQKKCKVKRTGSKNRNDSENQKQNKILEEASRIGKYGDVSCSYPECSINEDKAYLQHVGNRFEVYGNLNALYLRYNSSTYDFTQKEELRFLLSGRKKIIEMEILFSDIIGIEYLQNEFQLYDSINEGKGHTSQVLKRAIVGDLIAGTPGTIVGAMTATSSIRQNVLVKQQQLLRIHIKNNRKQYVELASMVGESHNEFLYRLYNVIKQACK